jgi:hypothetical protein
MFSRQATDALLMLSAPATGATAGVARSVGRADSAEDWLCQSIRSPDDRVPGRADGCS